MQLKQRSLGRVLVLVSCGAVLAAACGDAEDGAGGPNGEAGEGGDAAVSNGGSAGKQSGMAGKTSTPEGGVAAGGVSTGGAGGEALAGAGGTSEGGSAGAPAGAEVTFMVPSGGGDVQVMTASGNAVKFTFPASAAGEMITLTPATSASIGWEDGRFGDVIRMEPDGATFDEPIEIRTSNSDLMIFDFPTSADKHPAQGLPLNAAGDALLLSHFSTLVVVPPEYSCDSQSGWVATANSQSCTQYGTDSTQISFTCKAYSYCLLITASCCAPAGSAACEIGMSALTLSYQPRDSNGGQYPYCDAAGSGGGSGGTGGTAAIGGTGGGTATGGIGGIGGIGGTGGTATGGIGGTATGGSAGASATGGSAGSAGTGGTGVGGAAGGIAPSVVAPETFEVNGIRLDGGFAYFSSGGVSRVSVGGGGITPIVAQADFSGMFDVDATKVYFSSGGSLMSHAKDGTGSDVDLAVTGAVFNNSFIEEAAGVLYVANGIKILTAPIAGGAAAGTLVASEPSPTSLVVSGAELYFVTAVGTGTHQKAVMKVPTAGGAAVALVENLTDGPRAVSISGGYAYYITGTAIARVSTAGGTPEPVAASGGTAIAVDGSDVYFTGSALHHVGTTGAVVTQLSPPISNPRLALDATHVYYSTMSGVSPAPGVFRLAR